MRPFSFLIATTIILASCTNPDTITRDHNLVKGCWEISFDISASGYHELIPIRMTVDSMGEFILHNSGEQIVLDSIRWQTDSFHVKLPLFQTFLDGRRINDSLIVGYLSDPTRKGDYRIPFEAKYVGGCSDVRNGQSRRLIYDASFSPLDTAEKYKAIAILDKRENFVSGTFLTETGDYRYLEGRMDSTDFWLSCFDGSHLFYFTGVVDGDSIKEGRFYSGVHWSQPWEAALNENAKLRDPDSLTSILPGSGPFSFSAVGLNGEEKRFDPSFFKNKVTIVQIYGSWCPNCTDESAFLRSLYEKHRERGLQIVPVAFERLDDLERNRKIIGEQNSELRIPYETFIGGAKGDAKRVFPMLNRIMSFPTTVIIDRNGEVRKTHTGFYGPGTGSYHEHYTDRMELFIVQLLSEG